MTRSKRYSHSHLLRSHFQQSAQGAPSLHERLSGLPANSIPEVSSYFIEAWGNRARIDYGSGMELNFLCWMYVKLSASSRLASLCLQFDSICLETLGVVSSSDHKALVLKVFWRFACPTSIRMNALTTKSDISKSCECCNPRTGWSQQALMVSGDLTTTTSYLSYLVPPN